MAPDTPPQPLPNQTIDYNDTSSMYSITSPMKDHHVLSEEAYTALFRRWKQEFPKPFNEGMKAKRDNKKKNQCPYFTQDWKIAWLKGFESEKYGQEQMGTL